MLHSPATQSRSVAQAVKRSFPNKCPTQGIYGLVPKMSRGNHFPLLLCMKHWPGPLSALKTDHNPLNMKIMVTPSLGLRPYAMLYDDIFQMMSALPDLEKYACSFFEIIYNTPAIYNTLSTLSRSGPSHPSWLAYIKGSKLTPWATNLSKISSSWACSSWRLRLRTQSICVRKRPNKKSLQECTME